MNTATAGRISEATSPFMRHAPCPGLLHVGLQSFYELAGFFEVLAGFELHDQTIEVGKRFGRALDREQRLGEVEVDRITPAVFRIPLQDGLEPRSEERRVGKGCRWGGSGEH